MKKYIFNICMCLAACLTVLTSCDTDAEGTLYRASGAEFAFPSTLMTVELTADDNGVIKVPVYRGNVNSDAVAHLSLDEATVEEGVFTLANSTVTFEEGATVAYAELVFGDLANLDPAGQYSIDITLDEEENLSPDQQDVITVKASRKLTWTYYGEGVYTSEFFDDSWDQTIEKAEEGNIYRLPSCIMTGYPLIFSLSEDGQSLEGFADQDTGYSYGSYGHVYYRCVDFVRDGNVLYFQILAYVSAGSFGYVIESLELPE